MIANLNLKVFRTRFNLNQTEMAKILNITLRTYSKKERKGSFTQDEMIKILAYFKKFQPDITLDDIFLN